MSEHLPLILVEVVLVFGGVLAFGWWQLRDLRNERCKREAREREERARMAAGQTGARASAPAAQEERRAA